MLDTLTSRYLERVRGIPGSELIGSLPQSELLNGLYHGRYLSRPVFLDHGERARLHADLENLRGALVSLPGRLFGGDVGAFASAMGMTGYQREAIEREVGRAWAGASPPASSPGSTCIAAQPASRCSSSTWAARSGAWTIPTSAGRCSSIPSWPPLPPRTGWGSPTPRAG